MFDQILIFLNTYSSLFLVTFLEESKKMHLLEIFVRKFQDILFSTSRNSEDHSTWKQDDYSPVHADLLRRAPRWTSSSSPWDTAPR